MSYDTRYIVFSYKNNANWLEILRNPEFWGAPKTPGYQVDGNLSKGVFDFQDNVRALSQTREIIYDDGHNYILDLSSIKEK